MCVCVCVTDQPRSSTGGQDARGGGVAVAAAPEGALVTAPSVHMMSSLLSAHSPSSFADHFAEEIRARRGKLVCD